LDKKISSPIPDAIAQLQRRLDELPRVFGQGQKAAKTIRAGLYARVSTQDQQTLPMQSRAMREHLRCPTENTAPQGRRTSLVTPVTPRL